MASIGNKLARIDVLIGGADQARKQVEEMRKEWARLGKEIQAAQKQMEATVDTVDYDKNKAVYTEAVKQQKQLQKSIQETERNINTVEKYLADVSGQTLRNLNNARKGLNQMLLGINPKNFETLQTVRDYIKQIGDEIQRRKGNLIEFSDIMGNIGNVSDKSLGMAKQRLQELIATTEKNASEMQKYRDQLRLVEEEEQRRISSKAGRVMGNLDGSSVAEIQEAIKVTTQLRDAQKLGGQEWEIYNDEIQRAQKYLSDFNEISKRLVMEDKMSVLAKTSTSALAELKKYWQEQVNGAERGSSELAEYEKQLKRVIEEENKRSAAYSRSVLTNLSKSSYAEIQDAIKVQERMRDAVAYGSDEWRQYNQVIQQAKKYIQDVAEVDKFSEMAKRMVTLRDASSSSLAELKKFWQEQINGSSQSSNNLQRYQTQLEEVIKEEERRASMQAGKIMGNLTGSSVSEIQEAIKVTTQLRDAQKLGSTEWENYNNQIQAAQKYLEDFNNRAKQLTMFRQMGNLTKASTASLSELKKYWQEQINGAEATSVKLQHYQKQLEAVMKEEERRISAQAGKVMGNLTGSSVSEIQEAIKVTTQLRDAQKLGGQEWEIYNDEIQRAQKYLSDFNEISKRLVMEDKMSVLAKTSTSALAELKKYWQEQVNGAERGSSELAEYEKQLKRVIEEENKRSAAYSRSVLTNLSKSSYAEIQDAIKVQERMRDAVAYGSDEWRQYNQVIQQAKKYIQDVAEVDKFSEMAKRMVTLRDASSSSLAELKKFWQEQINGSNLSSTNLQRYQKQLEEVIKEEERRASMQAGKIMGNLTGSSVSEIQEAIKVTTQLRDAQKLGSTEWENYNNQIQAAQKYLEDFNNRAKQLTMFRQMGNLTKASTASLSELKKYWQEQINGAEATSVKLQHYQKQLEAVMKEEERRISAQAGKVMGNLTGSSVSEIQEAIKVTTQLRDAQKLGSVEWEIYNDEILKAQKYLKDFDDLGRQIAMSDRMQELGKVSTASLTELKKYWQEQVNGAQKGSQELAEYEKQLKKVAEEENKRTRERAINIVGDLDSSSVSEIQEAIKSIEQLRDSTARGSQQWDFYNENLKAAKNYLQEYAESDRRNDIAQRMQNIGNASTASLAELKKFWQEQVDGAELSSQSLQQYQQQLEAVIKEEQKRVSQRAQTTLSNVQGGTFNATIGETKEAIKLLEQYKQQLKVSDTQGIKDVDDAIKSLNERIKQASDNTMSLRGSLDMAEKVGEGTFDGTIEDLEKLKKSLEEYKKKTQISNTDGLKEIDNALAKINKRQEEVKDGAFDLQKTLNNLKKAPLNDLQKAAAELQEQLSKAERGTVEYITASEKLREVNGQIKEVKRSWEEHDNQIAATVKRLASYVLVYAGFNEVWGRIKQLYQANLELSDSMADIQKTTGLSAESVAELSKEIDGIDTRTAQQELHDLAYEAGKLGISAKEDVLGFVKAGNQLLVALGEDLGGAEAVRQLMKVNAILGETQKLGVEKALLATGSAINEISQTSRASAGPIVDIVTRIGAIGNAAGMSMSDLIALAGTVDALGQQSEMSSTALNTFISTLTSNTTEVAQAVGLSDDYLKNLISQGRTIEAVIAVFEKMNAMGGLDVLAPIMKDLGSDGERIKQVLVTLSSGVDELKAQIFTSSQAFKEATSVTDEYNIKNESAMAIMQRMGNAIRENFINSGFVEWITEVLRWMYNLPAVIERNRKAFLALKIVITEILILLAVAKWKAIMSMFVDFGKFLATPFTAIWRSLRIQVAAATIAIEASGKSTTGLIGKLRVLGKVIASNPWGLLATAVGAAVVYFADLNKKVSDAAKISADYNVVLRKEQDELENLRFAISKANTETGEKAALIKQLNDKYGAYLGFMVDENNYAEKQAYIYDIINTRLQETLALKMRDKMMENVVDTYSDKIQELNAQAIDSLNEMERIGETNAGDAMARIIRGIKKAAKEGLLPGDALKDFMDKYDYELTDIIYGKNRDLFTAVKGLLEIEKKIQEETKTTQQYLDGQTEAARATANELMKTDLEKYGKDFLSSAGVKELGTYVQQATTFVQRLRNEVEELNTKRRNGEELTEEENAGLIEKQKLIDEYSVNIEQAQKRIRALGLESVWGQGLSLETAGVDKLVAAYARLEDMMKSINEDKDYAETFAARGFKSAKEEYEALKKMEQDIAKVLKDKWGRDTKGNWLRERKGGGARGEEKRMREEIDSAMSALEAYFLRRQQAIRQAYIDEQITTEEMNRQIDRTEEEHLLARVELRKRLLGQESTFNKDLYGMSDKDLDKLAGFLKKLGDRETDGMVKNLEKDLLQVQEMAIKYRQEIEKELRKYNPFESLVYQFEESLDKLRLLSTDAEKIFRTGMGLDSNIGTEAVRERVNVLVELSEDAYNINETQLREYLSNIDAVWAESMSPEQMSLMLKKLRDFYQDSKAAAEKYAKDIRQMVEVQWQASGNDKVLEDMITSSSRYADMIRTAGSLGLTSSQSSILGTSAVDDAELETLRIKLEAAQKYYEQFYARKDELIQQAIASGATEQQAEESYRIAEKEALDELTKARDEQSAKELEITKSKLETLKGYTDAIVDFSEQMGEAAFGEVEDRKEAAKMLLQTTMKLTKDLIMQKIQELVMKKALGAQEVAQEAATSGAVTAIHGSQAVTDLTVQGAKTAGDISAGIASGSAKTVGQLGWWGIPLIAVISAALSALMGLAMGKLNKAKEEVASATGVSSSKGRIATGMLTYAKGDYPVLGNDGQIYNARYQKELKTGVYGGGAHFGIFSEKKPEMIVDGDTTQKLILNYPHIYDSILTIARHGQLKQAVMPTYATGNYPAQSSGMNLQGQAVMTDMMSNAQMQDTLIQLSAAVSSLTERLNKPISATMDPYQANKTLKKTDKFMNKRGLI